MSLRFFAHTLFFIEYNTFIPHLLAESRQGRRLSDAFTGKETP